jgi:hypothetical protein
MSARVGRARAPGRVSVRASAKAPALLTQRERFLKISDGGRGALARGRHRPAVASPAKQTAATVHAAAGARRAQEPSIMLA